MYQNEPDCIDEAASDSSEKSPLVFTTERFPESLCPREVTLFDMIENESRFS